MLINLYSIIGYYLITITLHGCWSTINLGNVRVYFQWSNGCTHVFFRHVTGINLSAFTIGQSKLRVIVTCQNRFIYLVYVRVYFQYRNVCGGRRNTCGGGTHCYPTVNGY